MKYRACTNLIPNAGLNSVCLDQFAGIELKLMLSGTDICKEEYSNRELARQKSGLMALWSEIRGNVSYR